MSKSTKMPEHDEIDESVLFDDGFSVVDDINAGAGPSQGDQKTNDEVKGENIAKKDVVSSNKSPKEPEKGSNEKDQKKETTKSCSDGSTLILSNDVDLGADPDASKVKVEKEASAPAPTNEEPIKEPSPKEKDINSTPVKKTLVKKKGSSSNFIWVTNISNSVNASSLKKHFSDCGRVNTAKVVTNGRLFFGYVEFDSAEIAQECVNKMNNTVLGGKKVSVSRSRPDVTRRSINAQKKLSKPDQPSGRRSEATKKEVVIEEEKKDSDKTITDDKKKSDGEKKGVQDKTKDEKEKKKKVEDKSNDDKTKTDNKDQITKDDLQQQMKETRKKLDLLRTALDRTQIEVRNLRRRLTNEEKKSKAEEMRAERYRQQMRKLTDELKEAKEDYKKEMHRLTKKHKVELEKAEFDRESFLKREEDLRRRQEDLGREFKKLEEARKSFEHLKRSRKSRSMSPPAKRFRGRDAAYPDVSPPPPPKLSGDVRKPLLERPPYYEEKKPRGVYDRLGDYTDKPLSRDSSNGRYRGSYPVDGAVPVKSSWSQHAPELWKKSSSQGGTNFMKPYMERFGTSSFQPQSSSYFPPGTSDYTKRFDSSRKY